MVGLAGIEPATNRLWADCSNHWATGPKNLLSFQKMLMWILLQVFSIIFWKAYVGTCWLITLLFIFLYGGREGIRSSLQSVSQPVILDPSVIVLIHHNHPALAGQASIRILLVLPFLQFCFILKIFLYGGREGIRTLEASFPAYSLSRGALSTTQAPFRIFIKKI